MQCHGVGRLNIYMRQPATLLTGRIRQGTDTRTIIMMMINDDDGVDADDLDEDAFDYDDDDVDDVAYDEGDSLVDDDDDGDDDDV